MIYMMSYECENHITELIIQATVLTMAKDWSRYMRHTWLIVSDDTAKEISDKITNVVTEKNIKWLLIMEIKPDNYGGWMPQEAWDWLEKNKKEAVK